MLIPANEVKNRMAEAKSLGARARYFNDIEDMHNHKRTMTQFSDLKEGLDFAMCCMITGIFLDSWKSTVVLILNQKEK